LKVGTLALLLLTACASTNERAEQHAAIRFAPRLLNRQDLRGVYPPASIRAGETGEVILHVQVGADGVALKPIIVERNSSVAYPRLIETAQRLLLGSRYEVGDQYRRDVGASVLFELMPCGTRQATSGLDVYYRLCVPPQQISLLQP
jgi:hypothetical protein